MLTSIPKYQEISEINPNDMVYGWGDMICDLRDCGTNIKSEIEEILADYNAYIPSELEKLWDDQGNAPTQKQIVEGVEESAELIAHMIEATPYDYGFEQY